MPKQVEVRVVVGDHGKEGLQPGDVIAGTVKGTMEVTGIELKQKWAFIYDGNVRIKLPIGSEVNVTRNEPTDAELLNDRLGRFSKRVIEKIAEAKAAPMREVNMLNMKHQEGRKAGYLMSFDLDRAFSVVKAEINESIWRNIEADAFHAVEKLGVSWSESLVRAVVTMNQQATQYLLSDYNHRVLSRSTSLTSNLQDDLKRQAYAEYLDWFKYDTQPSDLLAAITKEA